MLKNKKIYKYFLLAALFAAASFSVSAQDLGSSNGLFNASNPKTKTTPKAAAKKPAAKKPVAAAAKKAPKTTATKKTVSKPKTAAVKSAAQNTAKSSVPKTAPKTAKDKSKVAAKTKQAAKTPLQKNVVITVGQPSVVNNAATTAAKTEYDEDFERAIEAGNSARDEREYTRAEAAYLRAQTIKTKDSRAIYGLGNLYSDQARWEEAERAYRTAIHLEPTSPDAYVALSFILTQPIIAANISDRYIEAEKTARQAIALDPTNAVAFDQLGVALELGGAVGGETQRAYKKAIELEPNFALAYAHLGRLLRRKGSNNESAAAYRSAIQYSADVPTMILVADVMQSQQKFLESEQLLREAIRQDPKNPTALYLLGRALTTRGSFEEAEKVLKKSAEVSPNSFVAYSLLGSLFMRREKFDDAEKYLMRALKMVSPNEKKRLAQDFEAVGDGFSRVGKNKDAARVYQQAVLLDSEKPALTDKLTKAQNN